MQRRLDPNLFIHAGIDLRPERGIMLIQAGKADAQLSHHLAGKHGIFAAIVIALAKHNRLGKRISSNNPFLLTLRQLRKREVAGKSRNFSRSLTAGKRQRMVAAMRKSHRQLAEIVTFAKRNAALHLLFIVFAAVVFVLDELLNHAHVVFLVVEGLILMIDGGGRYKIGRGIGIGAFHIIGIQRHRIAPFRIVRMIREMRAKPCERLHRFVFMAPMAEVLNQPFGCVIVEKAGERNVPIRDFLLLAVHNFLRKLCRAVAVLHVARCIEQLDCRPCARRVHQKRGIYPVWIVGRHFAVQALIDIGEPPVLLRAF